MGHCKHLVWANIASHESDPLLLCIKTDNEASQFVTCFNYNVAMLTKSSVRSHNSLRVLKKKMKSVWREEDGHGAKEGGWWLSFLLAMALSCAHLLCGWPFDLTVILLHVHPFFASRLLFFSFCFLFLLIALIPIFFW